MDEEKILYYTGSPDELDIDVTKETDNVLMIETPNGKYNNDKLKALVEKAEDKGYKVIIVDDVPDGLKQDILPTAVDVKYVTKFDKPSKGNYIPYYQRTKTGKLKKY